MRTMMISHEMMPYKKLTHLEEIIANDGERLIPGVTHDLAEVVRHRSSYIFFCEVIRRDLTIIGKHHKRVQIVELGCGVGHGCYTLSELPNSHIFGIDHSPESLTYARTHYARSNITYQLENLINFIPEMLEYDYVTSRGVFEHVSNGLRLALLTKWRYRLLFDVPYDEPEGGNPHHVLHGIREEAFVGFPNVELFFQDLAGVIYDIAHKPAEPNMILCVCSHPDLPKVGSGQIGFPLPAWQPKHDLSVRGPNRFIATRRLRRVLQKLYRLTRVALNG